MLNSVALAYSYTYAYVSTQYLVETNRYLGSSSKLSQSSLTTSVSVGSASKGVTGSSPVNEVNGYHQRVVDGE